MSYWYDWDGDTAYGEENGKVYLVTPKGPREIDVVLDPMWGGMTEKEAYEWASKKEWSY